MSEFCRPRFGWLGILLLRLNLPEFEATRHCLFAVKIYRRLWRTVRGPDPGQGQCPILNLEDGEDHFADAILIRAIFDGGVELLWVCACRQCKCRLKPKVRVPVEVE